MDYTIEELVSKKKDLKKKLEKAWDELPVRDRYFHEDYDEQMSYIRDLQSDIADLEIRISDLT